MKTRCSSPAFAIVRFRVRSDCALVRGSKFGLELLVHPRPHGRPVQVPPGTRLRGSPAAHGTRSRRRPHRELPARFVAVLKTDLLRARPINHFAETTVPVIQFFPHADFYLHLLFTFPQPVFHYLTLVVGRYDSARPFPLPSTPLFSAHNTLVLCPRGPTPTTR